MEFKRSVPDIVGYDGIRSVSDSLRQCAERWPGWFPKLGGMFGDRHRVRGVLAENATGVVLLAWDMALEREVALKVIHPDRVVDPEARARLLDEARALAKVRHENVLEVFAFDDHQGAPFFTMEFVPGQHVASWLDSLGRIPVGLDEGIGIVDQVCRGVSAIHSTGSNHRDLTWSNVLLGPAFRVCVANLGLAPSRANSRAANQPSPYLAPELLEDAGYEEEPRSDVYALGVMALELLSGCTPDDARFQANLSGVNEVGLEPELNEVFQRACAPDPERRTPTPEAFRRELHEARRRIGGEVSMGHRFVVADDDDDFAELITTLLETTFEGCEVLRVANGEQALLAIGHEPPALAILDIDMPGLNGVELTAMLRAEPSLSQMPIIVATATGGAPDWRVLRSLGADGFVVKPVDPLAFIALTRRTLGYAATMRPSALPA
jgi:serine/threonine-protein kinase